MANHQTGKCEFCNIEFPRKQLKRVNRKYRCFPCHRKKKMENREHLVRDVLGIRKRSDLLIEWQKKREESEKLRKIVAPKTNGVKKKIKLYNSITQVEKQFLYRKYETMGLSYQEMKERIENDTRYLNDLVKELREQNKSEENISDRFKEEFGKLIMENGQ